MTIDIPHPIPVGARSRASAEPSRGEAAYFLRWNAAFIAFAWLLALAFLAFAGCYPYSEKALVLKREEQSIRARTQPDDRLTALQRLKLQQDQDAFEADISAVASGR